MTIQARVSVGLCLGLAALAVSSCATPGIPVLAGTGDDVVPGPARTLSMFVASARQGERGAASEVLAEGPLRLSLQRIVVPAVHETGRIERPGFGGENPREHFVVASRRSLDETAFFSELAAHVSGRVGSDRDLLLYVHGFNTPYDEARFRLAQIAWDGRFGGVPVLFTWPSASNLLDYGAAKESATTVRDPLAKLIRKLADLPGVGRVHILAHSMGTWLTMEALRENAIAGSPDLDGKLGDVVLAAPDIDLNVFRQQIARIDPSHVSVLVAANDRALFLSRRLAGDRPRLGGLDPGNPADRAAIDALGVKTYDLTADSTGLIGHGTYADAPRIVRMIGARLAEPRAQDAKVQAVLGERPVDSRIEATELAPVPAAPALPSQTP